MCIITNIDKRNGANEMNKKVISYNRGYHDGKASKGFKNPIHKNWNGKQHFDKDYEKGYWDGFNGK